MVVVEVVMVVEVWWCRCGGVVVEVVVVVEV